MKKLIITICLIASALVFLFVGYGYVSAGIESGKVTRSLLIIC